MQKLVAMLFVAALVIGGGYMLTHQGQSTTVTTPNAPDVGTQARDAGAHAVSTGDAWYQTHASQLGEMLAFLIVGGLCWLIWTKLPKAGLVLLILVILLALGFVKMSG